VENATGKEQALNSNQQREHEMQVESLAYGGDGVGHVGERVVFIPDGVPGDHANIRILQDKGSFLRGEIVDLTIASPHRIEPFCPLADRCGGCQWQAIDYTTQLEWKRNIVVETLRRIGGIGEPEVAPCLPSPIERSYRTVARYPARPAKDGIIFGYFERKSHRIVDISDCPVAVEGINTTASVIRTILNEQFPSLNVSEISIRTSLNQESSLVSMKLRQFADCKEFAELLLGELSGLAGLCLWQDTGKGGARHLGTVGKRYRYETVGGKRFRIDERSFFQVNTAQAEQLVGTVGDLAEIRPGDKVVDAYGGVGLFSLSVAPVDNEIHLFDLSGTAVKDSRQNAREAGFQQFHALHEDARAAFARIVSADRIIIDPPRTGLGRESVDAACSLNAGVIVYVSCNPATLARDLAFFAANGYRIETVIPVDMFPHTYHIETVVQLKK